MSYQRDPFVDALLGGPQQRAKAEEQRRHARAMLGELERLARDDDDQTVDVDTTPPPARKRPDAFVDALLDGPARRAKAAEQARREEIAALKAEAAELRAQIKNITDQED